MVEVNFIVTGFGPFQGVTENPTSMIVNNLIDYLCKEGLSSLASSIRTLPIIQTTADDARTQIDRLEKEICEERQRDDSIVYVLLHLGVNVEGESFQLETCAYNEASFRIPDEMGFQPSNLPISKGAATGSQLFTTLDVPELVESMNRTCGDAVASSDPGRFVCNYTYYCSLDKCCNQKAECLFLHVPPLSRASLPKQLHFVANLLQSIDEQVQRTHGQPS